MKNKKTLIITITIVLCCGILLIPNMGFTYFGVEKQDDVLNRFDLGIAIGNSINWNLLVTTEDLTNTVSDKGYAFVSGGVFANIWLFDAKITDGFDLDFYLDTGLFFLRKGYKVMNSYYDEDYGSTIYADVFVHTDNLDIPALFKILYSFGQIAPDTPFVDNFSIAFKTGPQLGLLMTSEVEVTNVSDPTYDNVNNWSGTYGTGKALDIASMMWVFGLSFEYVLPIEGAGKVSLEFLFNLGLTKSYHQYITSSYVLAKGSPSNLFAGVAYTVNLGEIIGLFSGGSTTGEPSTVQMEVETRVADDAPDNFDTVE